MACPPLRTHLRVPFPLSGLHWGNLMLRRNLKKFPRGSWEPFGAPPTFFFAPRRPPRRLRSVPEGSRRGFRAILKMLKNRCILLLFRPWGDLWAVQGGQWASCWPSRAPRRGVKELDRVIGGGPGDLLSAAPSFRKVPWGARGRQSGPLERF